MVLWVFTRSTSFGDMVCGTAGGRVVGCHLCARIWDLENPDTPVEVLKGLPGHDLESLSAKAVSICTCTYN
eukprot:4613292-Amphidinium_carterae.1